MKKRLEHWLGYCLEGLVLLSAAGWGLIGSGRWEDVLETEVMSHD